MKYVIPALLVLVGLINFAPVVGVLSAERLSGLYGITAISADLEILLRHRAVLFGLLGGFIIASAFVVPWRIPASVAGLVSMVAFIVLAAGVDGHGEEVSRVVLIDIVACVAILMALVLQLKARRAAA